MNWYIGQEIVCVKTHSQGFVVRGKSYKIKKLQLAPCKCSSIDIDVGVHYDSRIFTDTIKCNCGFIYIPSGVAWLDESLFAPLDQDISELKEILEKEATA